MKFLFIPVTVLILSVGVSQMAQATSDITISSPTMVDTMGHALASYTVGEQIGVQSVLTNQGTANQGFTYIVQIIDSSGGTQYLQGTSASMLPSQSFNATQVWIPQNPGTYTVEVFVWNSLASAIPLTSVLEKTITVQS